MRILIKIKRIFRKKIKLALLSTVFCLIFFLCYQYKLSTKLPPDENYLILNSNMNTKYKNNNPKQELLHSVNLYNKSTHVQYKVNDVSHDQNLQMLKFESEMIRGVQSTDYGHYKPNTNGNFVCLKTKDEISFSKVNDDYCDCPVDGSDEPATNACANGKFYCVTMKLITGHIPSSRVNDGICDCCDGSDEWALNKLPFRLSESRQKEIGRYQTPCPNICSR